jgi:hypothetical protein
MLRSARSSLYVPIVLRCYGGTEGIRVVIGKKELCVYDLGFMLLWRLFVVFEFVSAGCELLLSCFPVTSGAIADHML